jgi:hypothetical protein
MQAFVMGKLIFLKIDSTKSKIFLTYVRNAALQASGIIEQKV